MVGKKLLLSIAMLGAGIMSVSAQGYYDDDIYYDPAKDTKAKQEKIERAKRKQAAATTQYYNQYNYDPTLGGHDYAGADTYTVTGTSARDVDEYNRRGKYAQVDTAAARQAGNDDFAYTRRIEKYHNSDIISDINDPALVEYYYSTQPEVNIIINSPGWYSPWAWNYYDWYWGPSWSWPYYSSWWGPSWSWGWGGPAWAWGPSWSWGWGPSWGYDPWWGPAWGPVWGGGWSRPYYNPRHPGAAHRPSATRPGSNRPATGLRPGRHQSTGTYRPGNNSYRRPSAPAGNYRRPASGNNGNYNSNQNQNQNQNYNNYTRPGRNNSSSDSYRHNSGSTYRQSSTGSFRSSGGTRSGGGGSRGRH